MPIRKDPIPYHVTTIKVRKGIDKQFKNAQIGKRERRGRERKEETKREKEQGSTEKSMKVRIKTSKEDRLRDGKGRRKKRRGSYREKHETKGVIPRDGLIHPLYYFPNKASNTFNSVSKLFSLSNSFSTFSFFF